MADTPPAADVHVCPGCGVRATEPDAEHLNDCPCQGREVDAASAPEHVDVGPCPGCMAHGEHGAGTPAEAGIESPLTGSPGQAPHAANRQASALERLANLIIEHGLIIYHGDPDPFSVQKKEAGAWQVPTRIYVGIPQFKQPTTANDLPLDADEADRG